MGKISAKTARRSKTVKKIVLAPSAYFPSLGGVEELTRKLAAEYLQRGLQVKIITSKPKGSKLLEKIDKITVHRFYFFTPAKKIYNLLRFVIFFPLELLRLLLLIKSFNPELIHLQCNGSQTYYFYLASKILKIKLIDTLQGETVMDEHQIYKKSRFFRSSLTKVLKQSAFVTACSKAALTDAAKYQKINNKSAVIFNGIDLQEFQAPVPVLKQKYIFATGRFTYNKGFDLLVKAFEKISKQSPELKLFIGGDGLAKPPVEQYLQKHKLQEKIILTGRLDRRSTVRYMRNSLFLVMPSRYEPFGIVALEGLAAGKAVLVTKFGGPPEFISEKVGYTIDPNKLEDFSAKLKLMLKNYRRLEKNSAALARNFTWSKIAAQYLEIYTRISNA